MSLLHFFISNNFSFEVLHINHLTRGSENDYEFELIKTECEKANIKLHYYEYAHQTGNFQASAREYRYKVARKIIAKSKLTQAVTAHHADDSVENILMYKDKISYRGINYLSELNEITIVRPLIEMFKEDIYEYARNNNVKFNEDISNQKCEYLRNDYRNNILSKLTKVKKQRLIEQEYSRVMNMPDLPQELTSTYLRQFTTDEQAYLLHSFLKNNMIYNIKRKFIFQVLTDLTSNGTLEYTLNENFILRINYGVFSVESAELFKVNNWQELKYGTNCFNQIEFEYFNNVEELFITTRTSGDRIKQNGLTKKVNRLMIEYKIPKNLRDRWPIICDKNRNLLYLPKNGRNIV